MLPAKDNFTIPISAINKAFPAFLLSRVLLGFVFLFYTAFSNATVTYITDANSSNIIDVNTQFLLAAPSLTVDEIIKEEYEQKFITSTSNPANYGFQKKSLWIKLTYQDKRTISYKKDMILEISNPLLDYIELYRPSKNGFIPFKTGALENYKSREINSDFFLFYLPDAEQTPVSIYIKINSQSPLIIPLSIKSVHDGFASGNLISYSGRVLVGMLCLIISYNLLLSFGMREVGQYFYLIWYSLATVTCSLLMGVAQPYLGIYAVWFTENLWLMGSFASAFFLLHVITYVNLNNINPILNKITLLLSCGFIANGLFVVFTDNRLWQWTLITCGICGIITPIIISYGIYLKQRMAWLGVTVFSPTFIGLLIYILASVNVIESSWFTLNSLFIGIAFTGVSIALTEGNKINEEKTKRLILETKNRKALELNNDILKKSHAVKDAFLSTISHELRTPLNGASGALCLLEDSVQQASKKVNIAIPEDISHLFKVVNDSTNEMISLINSIIGFSELHIENTKLDRNFFSPHSSIVTLIQLQQLSLKNNNNKVHTDIDSISAIEVLSDEKKYNKVIGIIFDNANKFTQDGVVTVQGNIDKSDDKKAKLIISITDTGVGIPESEIETILEPFSQADQSYSRRYGGLGIGLAVCKKTMELLGGELRLSSEPSKGTSVQLIFEITEFRTLEKTKSTTSSVKLDESGEKNINEASPNASSKSCSSENKSVNGATDENLNVLIVEDNETNQLITKRMIQKLGFNTFVAENGAVAVALFREQHIDLVLMDCQMPVMDGFDATREIRVLATAETVLPIIAITANTSDEDQLKCKESGMDDILSKPVSYSDLRIIIEKWVEETAADKKRV